MPMLETVEPVTLGELIERLCAAAPDRRVALGFTAPHSYRGYYDCLAFEVMPGVTVAAMLQDAKSADGRVFEGWKGGSYRMNKGTAVYLVTAEGNCGAPLDSDLLSLLLDTVDG